MLESPDKREGEVVARMGVLVIGWRVGGEKIWSEVEDIFLSVVVEIVGAVIICSLSFWSNSFVSWVLIRTQSLGGGDNDALGADVLLLLP